MAKLVKGIIAAMVTSMHDDESLNMEEIKNQVNRQIAARCGRCVLSGDQRRGLYSL